MKDKCTPESMRAMNAATTRPNHASMQSAKHPMSQAAQATGKATSAHVDAMMSKANEASRR